MDAAKGPGRGFGEFWRLLASFDGWQTAPLNHVKVEFRGWTGLWTLPEGQASLGSLGQGCGSTPPVVPGAAPALAKAGVGGLCFVQYSLQPIISFERSSNCAEHAIHLSDMYILVFYMFTKIQYTIHCRK